MIIYLAVMLVAGLILAVGWWNEVNKNQELKSQIEKYQDELSERPLPEANKESEPDEVGTFVKTRMSRPATPETYRNVFDLDVNGQRVIAHLTSMYANKSTYVRGGHDAERESCFRAGQADVIGFIYKQINRANDPDYKEEQVND
ncbi:hypothetical protein [Acinetobacter sp. ASP199]|uniref:Bbp19 family protein n=1 Tax=unclassified Acinetobacter TaxID=196816 RepID=UPI001F603494|nr:hypothetical protein [Acinetobacter sp. ASP199]UNT60461.1 hypothetical protein IHE35_06585 [Acinetobacter sp. ASP199]